MSLTKEEKCELLSSYYGWTLDGLIKFNISQIDMLYASCLDENGELRNPQVKNEG
jgi:hypothetical protein